MTHLCALDCPRLALLSFLCLSSTVAAFFEPNTYNGIAHVIAQIEANGGFLHQIQDPIPTDKGYGAQGYEAQGYEAQGYGAQGYGAQGYDSQRYRAQEFLFVREPSISGSTDFMPKYRRTHHDAWMASGKYQGDIDGITSSMLQDPVANVFYNGLRNKKLMWPNGIIPYKLDSKFTQSERNMLEKAFQTYRDRTCIKFVPHTGQADFLQISKGYGCYSQVGRNGGQQEMSLGRGCLFHEIIVHELMHAVGFWHEHSRSDRDSFIRINWGNILPGMQGQFDKISASFQDLLGETYDYHSVMHYDSTAFSKNGQNTIETVQPGFTSTIGAATDLSEADVKKINKLYNCAVPTTGTTTTTPAPATSRTTMRAIISAIVTTSVPEPTTTTTTTTTTPGPIETSCQDRFLDCPYFNLYCERASFYFVMKSYCPLTCKHCTPTR